MRHAWSPVSHACKLNSETDMQLRHVRWDQKILIDAFIYIIRSIFRVKIAISVLLSLRINFQHSAESGNAPPYTSVTAQN